MNAIFRMKAFKKTSSNVTVSLFETTVFVYDMTLYFCVEKKPVAFYLLYTNYLTAGIAGKNTT